MYGKGQSLRDVEDAAPYNEPLLLMPPKGAKWRLRSPSATGSGKENKSYVAYEKGRNTCVSVL